ncbi:hypothetical protein DL546_007617 [Coniochaeta pulveracea]|uniref:Uncharacterized protein n=1 Tax=Coniochaeta pulveracea TaxID=177199 RepID=A0A420YBH4_9PEZI|nr:hypothetical protein DL546_007617 [Coniochaeta pulveracea]
MGESIPQIRLPSPLPRTNPPSPISNTSRIQEIRTQTLEADLVNDQLSEILAEQKKLVREIVKLKEQNLRDVSEVEANAETRRLAEQKAELLQQRTSRSLLAPDPDSNRGISLPDRLESPPPMRRARSALPAARFGGDSSLSVTEQKVESRSRIGQKPDINKNSLMPDRLDSPPPMQRRRSCLPNNRFGGDSPLSAPEQNFHHPPQDRASRSRISLEPDNNKSDYLRDRLDSPPPMQRRRSGLPTAPFGGDSPPSEPEQKFQPFQDRASRSRIGALEPDSNRTNSLRDRLDSPPPMGRVRSGLPNIRFGGDGPLSGPEHKVNPLQDRARRSHLALEPDNYKGMPLRERLDSPPSMQRRPSGGLPTTRFGGESPPSGPKQKFQPFQDRVSRSRIGALEPDNDRGMSLPDRSESPPPMRRARSALPTARFGGNSLLPGSDNRHRSSFLGDNDEGYASHDDSGRWEGGNKRRSALLVTARRTGIDAEMGSSEDCDILSEVDRIRNKTAAAGATGTREAIRQLEQCLRDVKRNDADDPMDGLMRERSRRGI